MKKVNDVHIFNFKIFNYREISQDSDIREFQVKNRDLILLSSDGMFDVVSDEVLLKIVNNHNEKVTIKKLQTH